MAGGTDDGCVVLANPVRLRYRSGGASDVACDLSQTRLSKGQESVSGSHLRAIPTFVSPALTGVFVAMLSLAAVAEEPEQCAEITVDATRLACFDLAFPSRSAQRALLKEESRTPSAVPGLAD